MKLYFILELDARQVVHSGDFAHNTKLTVLYNTDIKAFRQDIKLLPS